MAGKWEEIPLGDLYEFSSGLSKPRSAFGSGYLFLSFKDIFYNIFVPKQLKELVESSSEEQTRCSVKRGDVFLTRTSETMDELGMSSIAREDVPNATFNGFTKRLRPKNASLVVPEYAGYFFRSREFRKAVTAMSTMSTRASLNNEMLARLTITLPPVEEQTLIGQILSTLDDKIELNRRMNETLETIARALFKSWFVDFDPVRAKAEGRDPGLPKEIAGFFPDSFEDSDLGEIPKGWRLSCLGAEAETLLGGTPSRVELAYWGGEIPWINSGKANEFRIVEPSEFITQAGLESSATKLLPTRTTVIAITGATLGQVSITEISTCANQSIVGVLGSAVLPSEYIYFWVKENIDRLIASQTGGAQQHINKNNVNELPIVCPAAHVVRAYMATAFPIFERIKKCCFESRTLSALRDTLLPKLISGELRVNDAERIVEIV